MERVGEGLSAGAPMDDASLNRRQTMRIGSEGYAHVGIVGFDGPICLQVLWLHGSPDGTRAVPNGTPLLSEPLLSEPLSGSNRREFAAAVSLGLPSLGPGGSSLLDTTVTAVCVGELAQASLATSRFFELDARACSNSTVRVLARNESNATIDLPAPVLCVQVSKQRVL